MTGTYFLWIAIALEVMGAMMLKLSNGFQNFLPTLFIFVFYASSYYVFSKALKTISLSIGYAIWSGAGIFLITLIGAFYWEESIKWNTMFGMILIVGGIGLLNSHDKEKYLSEA